MAARVRSFSNISLSSAHSDGPLAVAERHTKYPDNQWKSKASTARSFAVQDLPLLTLTELPMRTSEPNGVRIAEFSSI